MKRIAFFCIVLSSILNAYGQDAIMKLDGFLGIKWKSSISETKSVLEKRYILKYSGDKRLLYEGSFAGKNASIIVNFFDNQFSSAIVKITPEANTVLKEYRNISSVLIEKYGKPSLEIKEYYSPYREGDGHEETALVINKAEIGQLWKFSDGNSLFYCISKFNNQLVLSLLYSYDELVNMERKQAEEKNSSDF